MAPAYRVERQIGAGGMATVYLAQDLRHQRPVAIKVMRPELSQALGVGRFLQEIQIAARLSHPNIVPLLDSGDAGGLPWYAMPYVEGESLRQLLARERQLSLPDAVRIACDVAAALQHAHAKGIVHRDIKPENILLHGGAAVVADFGIARAITRAADADQLTRTGVSIGTPAYMSPEQAGAEHELDGRSDIYSLGCVLYEMLSGQVPFTGSSGAAILARHQLDPVPPLRTVRRAVPPALERVVLRCLQKVPADRFAGGASLRDALQAVPLDGEGEPSGAMPRGGVAVAAAAVGIVALMTAMYARSPAGRGGDGLDTTRYAVIGLAEPGAPATLPQAEQLLAEGLDRWDGVEVQPPARVREAAAQRRAGALSASDARAVARRVGAGRYVQLVLTSLGDSARAHATLFDTRSDTVVAQATAAMAANLGSAAAVFAALADSLLLRGTAEAPVTTRSLPAWQAFARGQAAVRAWDLAAADSAFAAALRHDPRYADASLWLGMVRWWGGTAPANLWRSDIERAIADSTRLWRGLREAARALAALGGGNAARACDLLGRYAARESSTFAAWYSLATCLRRDAVVVPDARSRSGWRFRSSLQQVSQAYLRAFLLQPAAQRALRADPRVRGILLTGGNTMFFGAALPPDSAAFFGYPELVADTLVVVPWPGPLLHDPPPGRRLAALRRQARDFFNVAAAWTTAEPANSEALSVLALALEALGDRAAVDTLRHARRLARSAAEQRRLATAEVPLVLKFALPADTAAIRAARALGDSLLAGGSADGRTATDVAGIATLLGRAQLAARIERTWPPSGADPRGAAAEALADVLVMYAALGGPPDSLHAAADRLQRLIDTLPPAASRIDLNGSPLRAAVLAAAHGVPLFTQALAGSDWRPARLAIAMRSRDTVTARRVLREIRAAHQGSLPGTITLDALYPTAALAEQLGDTADAARMLDLTIGVLPQTAPSMFSDPGHAGPLVHAMALRAELAQALGDRDAARRWARAVVILWSGADDFLQPLVRRMRAIAGPP